MADLALFDFDGTLTDSESYGPFLRMALPPERLRAGRWRVAPWVVGYRIGMVSGVRVRARVAEVGLRGASAAEYREAGARFAREWIPAHLRPEAMARLDWHRDRGDTIAVVSGAFDAYLEPWCRAQGVVALCSSLEDDGDRLSGHYAGLQCVAAEKVRRARERFDFSTFARVHAYGDTREDRELLALADERWYRGQRMGIGG